MLPSLPLPLICLGVPDTEEEKLTQLGCERFCWTPGFLPSGTGRSRGILELYSTSVDHSQNEERSALILLPSSQPLPTSQMLPALSPFLLNPPARDSWILLPLRSP